MKRDAHISSIYFLISLIKQTSSMPRAAAGRQRLFEPSTPEMLKPRGKCPSLRVAPGCSDTPGSPSHPAQRLGPQPSPWTSQALKTSRPMARVTAVLAARLQTLPVLHQPE